MYNWLKTSCAPQNIPSSTRHGSSFAARDTGHLLTVSLSSTSLVLLSSSSPNPDLLSTYPIVHCEDPRDGTSTPQNECQVKARFGGDVVRFNVWMEDGCSCRDCLVFFMKERSWINNVIDGPTWVNGVTCNMTLSCRQDRINV